MRITVLIKACNAILFFMRYETKTPSNELPTALSGRFRRLKIREDPGSSSSDTLSNGTFLPAVVILIAAAVLVGAAMLYKQEVKRYISNLWHQRKSFRAYLKAFRSPNVGNAASEQHKNDPQMPASAESAPHDRDLDPELGIRDNAYNVNVRQPRQVYLNDNQVYHDGDLLREQGMPRWWRWSAITVNESNANISTQPPDSASISSKNSVTTLTRNPWGIHSPANSPSPPRAATEAAPMNQWNHAQDNDAQASSLPSPSQFDIEPSLDCAESQPTDNGTDRSNSPTSTLVSGESPPRHGPERIISPSQTLVSNESVSVESEDFEDANLDRLSPH
ncbi:unnamed protein product [Periconia digitata]|uniref:Uncharacterized protein n=1 Tax=Periconia digitata TaxID=1303443 RepID=A0A9W4UAV5_9PLEO|nr:unnamed protein product [Periconia digitata]